MGEAVAASLNFRRFRSRCRRRRTIPGGIIDFDRTYGGVDARVQLALDAVTLTLGVNIERLDEDRRGL